MAGGVLPVEIKMVVVVIGGCYYILDGYMRMQIFDPDLAVHSSRLKTETETGCSQVTSFLANAVAMQ